ncbi:hypothetical protein [Flavobacterium chungnamense]
MHSKAIKEKLGMESRKKVYRNAQVIRSFKNQFQKATSKAM